MPLSCPYCKKPARYTRLPDKSVSMLPEIYAILIVGAKTAEGVIARKLSDDRRDSALVLEAGINRTEEKIGREL